MSSTSSAEQRQLLALMLIAALLDQLSVRIVCRTRLGPLFARDRQLLLRQVLAGEVIREIGRGEDQAAVVEAVHSS